MKTYTVTHAKTKRQRDYVAASSCHALCLALEDWEKDWGAWSVPALSVKLKGSA